MFVFQNFDGDNAGVIPRCLREMFLTSEENSENQDSSSKHVDISASFIEIYNEKVYDLLGNNTTEPIVAKGMYVLISLENIFISEIFSRLRIDVKNTKNHINIINATEVEIETFITIL